MIQCCLCQKNYIDADLEIVCEECRPKMEADIAVWDVLHAIERMDEKVFPDQLKTRLTVLKKAYQALGTIIEMVEKYKC